MIRLNKPITVYHYINHHVTTQDFHHFTYMNSDYNIKHVFSLQNFYTDVYPINMSIPVDAFSILSRKQIVFNIKLYLIQYSLFLLNHIIINDISKLIVYDMVDLLVCDIQKVTKEHKPAALKLFNSFLLSK